MPNHLHQLYLVFDEINSQPGISKQQLLQRMEHLGYPIAARTLERHMTILRDKYFINVAYDHSKRGYYIDGPADYYQNAFQQFAKSQAVNGVFQELVEKGVDVWDVVGIDDQYPKMNMQALKRVITATIEHQRIMISYHKFYQEQAKEYMLEPHYIRQVDKRWYLFATDVNAGNMLKTFGFERIEDARLLSEGFEPKTAHVKEISGHAYGVTNFDKQRELVILHTNHWQGKYFETLPVHKSQKVEYLDNDVCEIKLNIAINPELMQLLASQRQTIKVVAPAKLKEDYKKFIQKKLKDLD